MKLREQAYAAFIQQLPDPQLLPGQLVSQREPAAATCMSLAVLDRQHRAVFLLRPSTTDEFRHRIPEALGYLFLIRHLVAADA